MELVSINQLAKSASYRCHCSPQNRPQWLPTKDKKLLLSTCQSQRPHCLKNDQDFSVKSSNVITVHCIRAMLKWKA